MAKKTQRKTNAKTPAKSLAKATKPAKVRAALLSTVNAKKTTLERPASRKPRPVKRRTPAEAKALAAMKRDDILPEEVTPKQTSEPPFEIIEDIRASTATPEDLRETKEASRAQMTAPGTGSALGAAHQVVDAMPRATRMAFKPLNMLVRHQALVFGLTLEMLQMQRQFFDMWRPRHR